MTAEVMFDGAKCGHTDMSPCLGDLGEAWLRYEVLLCLLFVFAVFVWLSPCFLACFSLSLSLVRARSLCMYVDVCVSLVLALFAKKIQCYVNSGIFCFQHSCGYLNDSESFFGDTLSVPSERSFFVCKDAHDPA
jgi:hypothetical protein